MLNKILSYAIAVVNAIAKIFGGTGLKVGGGGGSSPIGGAAEDAGDLANNMGQANDNAKKFKATIAGFDELETLNPQPQDSGGGGGGLGGGGIDVDDLDSYFDMGSMDEMLAKLEEWFQKIKDLWDAGEFEEIGREIAKVLNKFMYWLDEWILKFDA